MRWPVASHWAAAALAFACVACGHKATVPELTEEFVYTALSFSPSAATAAGLHEYKGLQFDGLLDDISPAATSRQRAFYQDFNQRLTKIDAEKLSPGDRADLAILQDRTGLALLELDRIHSPLHNPALYTEILGRALFTPYAIEYAPKAQRFRDIVSRLRLVPRFLEQAASNLSSVPGAWCKTAIEENQGNIDLVDSELRNAAPPELRQEYGRAAGIALPAMRNFQDLLTNRLQYLDNYNWRLGADLYGRKFRLALESAGSAQDVLESAEKRLVSIRERMYNLALPLYLKLPSARKDVESMQIFERQQTVIGAVLANIAGRSPAAQSDVDAARKDVEEARSFVRRLGLITLPANGNLQVAPAPAFARAVNFAGGFDPAPPLEPQLNAFYWVTGANLGRCGFYSLKLLTLREAIPGRWVQMQRASALEPKPRRLLRSVFGNSAYIAGWAEYAAQLAIDAGYLDHSPELALMFAKERLRVTLNAVLDVRLHTLDMSDEEALDAMRRGAFEDTEESAEELQAAKLTSCQRPAAFVGWAKWLKARADYQAQHGGAAAEFHNAALKQGAVPMSQLVDVLAR
jgi:uncharacterized protein (DUF885 family)